MSLRDSALIAVVCGLCYFNIGGGTWHYDDFHSLVDNPHIRTLANVPAFFADPGYFSADAEKKMYRPLLLVTYALQYAVHGYEPLGYLVVNLLIHIAASLLVGALALQIIGDRRASLVSAVFFAAYPLAGEPVNYISSRSESLAACCYLGALLFFARDRRGASLLCYGLGLLVKSVVLTAPAVIWAYDRWVSERSRRAWSYFAPYVLVAVSYLVLISYNRFLTGSLATPVRDWTTQLLTQAKVLAYYLYLVAVPWRFNVEHQFFASEGPGEWAVWAGAGLVGSLAWVAWRGRHRIPAFALCWSAVVLLPTTLMPLNMLVNERRLYLVVAGLALVAGYLAGKINLRWQRIWLVFAVALCLQRNAVWSSELNLWQDAAAKAPQMYRVQTNLGKALQLAGREDEALAAYRRAIELDDRHADAFNNVATLYHLRGDTDRAIRWYERALERNPRLEEVHQNLGDAHERQGARDRALASYRRALAIDDSKGDTWSNYGLVLYRAGDLVAAESAFLRAVDLLPDQAEPYNNLANIFVDRRDYDRAEELYGQALRFAPESGQILANLGDLHRLQGRFDAGRLRLRQAVAIEPNNAEWHFRLGRLERAAGENTAAIEALARAVDLDAYLVKARVQWAELIAEAEDWGEAIAHFRIVLDQSPDYSRAWYGLATALDESGDRAGAIAAYRNFLSGWSANDERARMASERIGILAGAKP